MAVPQTCWPENVPHSIDYPNVPLFSLLEKTAENHPNNTAIIFQDNILAYGDLQNQVDRFAAALQGLGVTKGDRVALLLPNIPQFIVSYFGALKTGAIVTALNPLYKEREIKYQINDSGAQTLVVLDLLYPPVEKVKKEMTLTRVIITSIKDCLPPFKAIVGTLLGKVPVHKIQPEPGLYFYHDLFKKYPPPPTPINIDPKNDLALLQYTGGITGTPKGAMLTHYNLVSNAYMCKAWLNVGEKTGASLDLIPLYHIFGMTATMNSVIASAGAMILIPQFDVVQILGAIQKYKAKIFCGVPTIYSVLINHPMISKFDLSSVEYCVSGGSPLPPAIQKKFIELTGGVLVEGYGLTEASPVTHTNPLDPTMKAVRIGSIGLTWPDTEAKIVDESSGVELPIGMVGELVVKGPQVMKGYWKMPIETATVLRDGWLYTGDYAKRDEDGYYYIIDRKKDLIKYKGYSVYPREIEDVLYEHPAVKDCTIIGVQDELSGEIPKAFVVLKPGFKVTEEDLINFVKERVASYKRIRKVEFREELPLSSVGKVIKRKLREEVFSDIRIVS